MQVLQYPDYSLDFRFIFASYTDFIDPVIVKTDNPDLEFRIVKNANDFYIGLFKIYCGDYASIIGILNLKLREFTALGDSVYEPHSYLHRDYRRNGYMSSLYAWVLNNNMTLLSCGRQTNDSENLWKHLSNSFEFGYFDTRLDEIITSIPNQMMLESPSVCAFLRKKGVRNGTTNQVFSELACEA